MSANNWSSTSTYYDVLNRPDWQRITYDSGNYLITDWDNTGVYDWSFTSTYYDAQNRIIWQEIV